MHFVVHDVIVVAPVAVLVVAVVLVDASNFDYVAVSSQRISSTSADSCYPESVARRANIHSRPQSPNFHPAR